MGRILIVSNRSPVTVRVADGALAVERSAGGLATGLKGPHERSGGLWIGWPGPVSGLDEGARAALEARLAELRVVPVYLTDDEVERYYEGASNGVLWPLFHYLVDRVPLSQGDFGTYEAVNERFADVVAREHRPGDTVWVHDYQLMMVPALVRARVPDARIGFFLHIPFPSSELFRTLPQREKLLEGVLGADLVGFHAPSYVRHFASSAMRILGASTEVDRIRWQGRTVRLGVFPMGVDAAAFDALAREPEVLEKVAELRARAGEHLLVGVDRLDYTKGIPRRLLAYERLLVRHPELREKVRLVQVSVPSRTNVEAYQDYRDLVDALVGRIAGAFATPGWVPIHYLYRGLSEREVAALYRAADVALVTPIRDGMNLVAKEFVATRDDEDGVLVLSEFAGAAAELSEAVFVNPYDIDETAEAMYRAITMPREERRERMRALRRRVFDYDVHWWAGSFLDCLERAEPAAAASPAAAGYSPPDVVAAAAARLAAAPRLTLLLDYDGTLVPFARAPDLAAPDAALLDLLRALAARPNTVVNVVSGRARETLERWLGALPIALHAEHGLWSRGARRGAWTGLDVGALDWRPRVLAILRDFTARTPGSLVETKTASVAWHYRMVDPEYGDFQARELMLHLTTLLSNAPVEILPGSKVLEIRPHGVHKGRVVATALADAPSGGLVAALGDDRTDEDLFAALPEGSVAVHVGPGESRAPIRIATPREARALLQGLLRPGSHSPG